MSESIPCVLMRGGTSKGPFFLADHLPKDPALRDKRLLSIMGAPDARQIDGLGGGHPLTSKVAIVSTSERDGIDVEYLFLQVTPDTGLVSDSQNCGNMLAGVGPFAIEKGLVKAQHGETRVTVFMLNSQSKAELIVQTPERVVTYEGTCRIDGVPGAHAPVLQNYFDTAGAQCGALLPTGKRTEIVNDTEVTLIDNGMPCVLIAAHALELHGDEAPSELESRDTLKSRLEAIRLVAGKLMGLGDVSDKTIPKLGLVSQPVSGGTINTRFFIPHKVHQSVGVLAAASVAAASDLTGTVAEKITRKQSTRRTQKFIEHPTGALAVEIEWANNAIVRTGLVRTARKIMEGSVFP